MKWWTHSSLRAKIFVVFSSLILALLLLTLWFTQLVVKAQVQETLRRELFTTSQVFQELLQERKTRLLTNSILLASDYALKKVIRLASDEPSSLVPVAMNYQQRIGVDLLWITDTAGILLADSLERQESGRSLVSFPPVAEALASGEASATITEVDGALVQLVAVPVLEQIWAPDPLGFLVLGENIDDLLVQQLQQDTGSHISFLTSSQLFAASWSHQERQQLFPAGQPLPELFRQRAPGTTFLLTLAQERFLSIVLPVDSRLQVPLYALVQRSYDEALAPFDVLRRQITGIGLGAVIAALFIGAGLAGGITSPVRTLVAGMREIIQGNLDYRLSVQREDEIGFLARSFNDMVGGLAEREKIRDVMHKVVSPQIARELLQRGVALGGEEREASVLFADIRGFTTISETLPPPELLHLLNAYLGRMSQVIEAENGVIDKYIGDEVMALFGAPLPLEDHAVRAVAAALGMLRELDKFNTERSQVPSPWLSLRIGIGIATGPVVAGNVGAPQRLNYTVLGDTVNLASRLQGLTKEYSVPLIFSGATYERVAVAFPCRLVGKVAVRGRQQETVLYTVDMINNDREHRSQ